MSVLEFETVSYWYPGVAEPALRDVTLSIEPGEFVVVAGMSASGKSTLLRAACGLAPHFHGGEFAGTVRTGGLDTRKHGPDAISAVAGTLFQDPETQIVMGTVRGELAFGLENRGFSAAETARGVEEVALALGIEGLLDRETDALSGGEKQRVALGAALAGRPQIVLLDEPTSQLDPVAGDELVWFLRRLNEEAGVAVVLIEHRLERCLAAADRVIVMADGRVVCDAPPEDFLRWAGDAAPDLQTPAARMFSLAGIDAAPVGVKQAKRLLPPNVGGAPTGVGRVDRNSSGKPSPHRRAGRWRSGTSTGARGSGAVEARGVWHEFDRGPVALRGVDLQVAPGERVALMGRNGAGKSTLLRHLAGIDTPTRGRINAAGRVALLMQNPGDYLLHERVADEASPQALVDARLQHVGDRHPQDLSGGQRQRLALATVLDHQSEEPVAVCLDEPTRGMDRGAKHDLARLIDSYSGKGIAVIVATHDPEFVAEFAARVVLMADGRVIADATTAEVLNGGWYFSTEVARVLDGRGNALTPQDGARLLTMPIEVNA